MTSRELFKNTISGAQCARPPFWLMRQAGRYLPEYRELKEKYGFLGIVKTPEVAVEAALQPIRRFDFDCAIIFSDILAISEALDFPYKFKDGGGIILERRVNGEADVALAESMANNANIDYVYQNAKLLRKELPNKAIFGFCGAPFTLAAYMVEGESSPNFPRFRKFFTQEKELFNRLVKAIEKALINYCSEQAKCGVDAIQIFDSHASLIPVGEYAQYSGDAIARVFSALKGKVATSLFAGGMSARFDEIISTNADIYSIDSATHLYDIAKTYFSTHKFALQGNLYPRALVELSTKETFNATQKIISDMRPYKRHIFNLGHGITPDAKLENVEAMCECVKNFKD